MNWTLVSLLSIGGLMMGLLSVRGHTRGIEPFLWIVLAVFATLVIARTAGQRFFLHGLSVGIAWGVINGLTAASLVSIYARNNPQVLQSAGPGAGGYPPRLMFLLGAAPIGLATGLVLGALCWAASHVVKPAPPIASP